MKNNRPSIDGFIPRRPNSQLGDLHSVKDPDAAIAPIDRSLHTGDSYSNESVGVARSSRTIGRGDIDDSLREIDQDEPRHKRAKRPRKRERDVKAKHPRHKALKIIKWVIIIALVLGALVGAYVVLRTVLASNGIFKGNIFDIVKSDPLKQDANGRSNFLIVGTSEDDPGHEAAYLTDSIMIVSVDQTAKNAYIISVPRDLYVQYDMPCLPGYSGKINSFFSCVNEGEDDTAEQDRLAKTQAFIGEIMGIDIQYGVHVNYTVMRDVVNAIGGSIEVTIESRNPNGQMDSNFDWKCGATYSERIKNCPPRGHFIDYPNGKVTLDAEHALYLAQARGDAAPTYGFEQSNFDRERNQQKILVAIRDKAMSAGTLTNIGSVTGLIDALGKNLRTNIQTKEIRTLMDLARDIKSENVQSIDLFKTGEAQFTTRTIAGAGSVVLPSEGQFMYDSLRAYVLNYLLNGPVIKEEPNITVLNGSSSVGVAQTEADMLAEKGFIVDSVDNAPDGTYEKIEIYQITMDKTASAAKLKQLYGVTMKMTTPPVSVVGETDFVIIIGDGLTSQ
ncbi:MAG: LCP family protein [Candidatus Microsaccharimonas sp.]